MAMQLKPTGNTKTDIAVIINQLNTICNELEDVKRQLQSEYITRQEFDPVKKIVYGMVGLILSLVIGSLVFLIIRKP